MIMRRQVSLIATATAAGFLMSLFAVSVWAAEITEEKAKAIALENAGVNAESVTFIRAEQDWDDGRNIYEVEFLTKSQEEYDYELLAENGDILAIDYEKKATTVTSDKNGTELTMKQAEELALKHAGQDLDTVTMLKQKREIEDGRLVYEVEFYTSDYRKYEYEIDGKSGDILAWDYDADSDFARNDAMHRAGNAKSETTATKQKSSRKEPAKEGEISREEAKALALKTADLKEDQVTWGRLYKEYDDGRLIYKGEFFHNQMEYEFEIDVASGAVLDWDVESIYD